MTGFLYRMGIRIKDLGERLRVGGIIRMGLWLREQALYGKIEQSRADTGYRGEAGRKIG
jgi:hypothetical protein